MIELNAEKNKYQQERIERKKRADQAKRVDLIKRRLGNLAIGARFEGTNWDDFQEINLAAVGVKQECRRFAEEFTPRNGRCLVMLGSPGTGKNMLAAIIAQAIVKAGYSCIHTTALKMVRRVKDSWRTEKVAEQSVIDLFTAPDLLIIDEVGVQFGTAAEQLYLTEIINDRYEAMRSTIIISNLTGAQIKEVLGERAVDRFFENGSKVLQFNWPSYRRRQFDEKTEAVSP